MSRTFYCESLPFDPNKATEVRKTIIFNSINRLGRVHFC